MSQSALATKRLPELERFIVRPEVITLYASLVIYGRWKEKEQYLINDPYGMVEYVIDHVLEHDEDTGEVYNPWKQSEETIIQDPICATEYASALGERWKEAEPVIIQHAQAALIYARDVLQRRWKEAEPVIMKHETIGPRYQREVVERYGNR